MTDSKIPSREQEEIFEIKTPKREALLLSPSALVQVGASPYSKRYSAMRKIDFDQEDRKIHASAKRLNFFR